MQGQPHGHQQRPHYVSRRHSPWVAVLLVQHLFKLSQWLSVQNICSTTTQNILTIGLSPLVCSKPLVILISAGLYYKPLVKMIFVAGSYYEPLVKMGQFCSEETTRTKVQISMRSISLLLMTFYLNSFRALDIHYYIQKSHTEGKYHPLNHKLLSDGVVTKATHMYFA